MTIPPGRLILLDTTVLVHLARNDGTGKDVEARFGLLSRPERPLISTVTEGELLGLARYWKWGQDRISGLQNIVREFVRVEVGHREIVETYAEIYADGRLCGKPCGENDLWIAATAKSANAILLTCDRDFDWLHDRHITRVYVGQHDSPQ